MAASTALAGLLPTPVAYGDVYCCCCCNPFPAFIAIPLPLGFSSPKANLRPEFIALGDVFLRSSELTELMTRCVLLPDDSLLAADCGREDDEDEDAVVDGGSSGDAAG
jgi:hypothetical protein